MGSQFTNLTLSLFGFDSLIKERRVACGICALSRAGLLSHSPKHLDLMTSYPEYDNFSFAYISYYYNPKIDYDYCLKPSPVNPLILQPSKERAIVEYILNEKWCDEGVLIESLKNYVDYFRNDELLYDAADHFGLDHSVLDYWINEAINDEEV